MHHFGLDIMTYSQRFDDELLAVRQLEYLNIRTVIDIGANSGQFCSQNIVPLGERIKFVHSFEPIPVAYEKLQALCAKHTGWHAYPYALSDKSGRREFHVLENTTSSCLVRVTETSITPCNGIRWQ